MTAGLRGISAWSGRGRVPAERVVVPPDPRAVLEGPLDPSLEAIRGALVAHRNRLWLRRIVRRTWLALAAVAIGEAILWTIARFIPVEAAPIVAVAIPIAVALILIVAAVRARPSLGETALAVDVEGDLGDRVSSAMELAVAYPGSAMPPAEDLDLDASVAARDEAAETDRFVRRQRRDALSTLRTAPAMFKPRFSRNPAIAALAAVALLVPVLVLPNPQNAVIAKQRDVREAAERQAERLETVARDLQDKGRTSEDPRTRLAEELRELARQLRTKPDDLAANLRQLGAVESDIRARIDPASEQRASSLTSLSRSLSRAATGNPDANRDGDPEMTREDLKKLGDKLDEMTDAQRRDLARQLAEMQATARSADGAAATALGAAAQSLAQGDTEGARSALDRLGEAMTGAQQNVTTNRDLAEAASRLQDARRDLADAGQQGQGQQGQGQQGQGQGSPQPSGQGQGQSQGQGQGQGRARARAKVKAKVRGRVKVKAKVRVRGKARVKAKARVRGKARVKARARGKARVKAKARARVRDRAPSAVAGRTRDPSARASAATSDPVRRPARTVRHSSVRTGPRSSPRSTGSASRATRRMSRAPAATARPSRGARSAAARTTAP